MSKKASDTDIEDVLTDAIALDDDVFKPKPKKRKSRKVVKGYDVSVVICSYKTPVEKIEKTVESAFDQDVKVEVIIVDDGGSLNYKAPKDVTIIKHDENKGFAATANKGIEVATGEFIFVMGDDTFEPNVFGKMVALARESDGPVYVYGDVQLGTGVHVNPENWRPHKPGDRLRTSSGIIWPRKLYPSCKFWEPDDLPCYFPDYDFILQMEAQGVRGVKVDSVVFHHHPTPGGHSSNARKYDAKIRKLLWERYEHFKDWNYTIGDDAGE